MIKTLWFLKTIIFLGIYTDCCAAPVLFHNIKKNIIYTSEITNNTTIISRQQGVTFKLQLPKSLFFMNHQKTIDTFQIRTGLIDLHPTTVQENRVTFSGYYGQEMLTLKIHRVDDDQNTIHDKKRRVSPQIYTLTDSFKIFVNCKFSNFIALPYAGANKLHSVQINKIHTARCSISQMKHISGTKEAMLCMKIIVNLNYTTSLVIHYFSNSLDWTYVIKCLKIIQSIELQEIEDLKYNINDNIQIISYD